MLREHRRTGEIINVCRVLVRKYTRNRPLGRSNCRCILKEWDGRKWTGFMAQDRGKSRTIVHTVMNLRVQ
jgi:hypothetical protein